MPTWRNLRADLLGFARWVFSTTPSGSTWNSNARTGPTRPSSSARRTRRWGRCDAKRSPPPRRAARTPLRRAGPRRGGCAAGAPPPRARRRGAALAEEPVAFTDDDPFADDEPFADAPPPVPTSRAPARGAAARGQQHAHARLRCAVGGGARDEPRRGGAAPASRPPATPRTCSRRRRSSCRRRPSTTGSGSSRSPRATSTSTTKRSRRPGLGRSRKTRDGNRPPRRSPSHVSRRPVPLCRRNPPCRRTCVSARGSRCLTRGGRASNKRPVAPSGASRVRTGDLRVANATLFQLSYGPARSW